MCRAATVLIQLLVGVLWMTDFSSSARAQTPGAKQTEQEIRTIEQQEAQALLRGDTAELARFWAPDLIVTASSNKIRTGAEILDSIKSGQMKVTKLERRIERIAVHGSVAIAMGAEIVVPAGGTGAGKQVERRYTDVYAQKDGQWRLIARQASLIAATP